MSIYADRHTECGHEEDGFEPFIHGVIRSVNAYSRAINGRPDRDFRVCENLRKALAQIDHRVQWDAEMEYEKGITLCEGNCALVAVECDGADFHDAAKDALRDAEVLEHGIPTIRASGSEIMRNPSAVARRVMANLLNQLGTPVG